MMQGAFRDFYSLPDQQRTASHMKLPQAKQILVENSAEILQLPLQLSVAISERLKWIAMYLGKLFFWWWTKIYSFFYTTNK